MSEDLSALRKEDLIARRNQLKNDVARLNNMQMSMKIFLNSGYGAL